FVVMVDGNINAPAFGKRTLKLFEAELKKSVIPFVEKHYRAKTDSKDRALAGLSMGGLQTLYAGMNNTQLFSYLGVFSSGWIMPMQQKLADEQYEYMKNNMETIKSNLKLLWISTGGKEDIAYKNCRTMLSKFKEMNLKYEYDTYPGGHTWP